MTTERKKVCINCGNEVEYLFKQYSPTVLKLTNCDKCDKVADKYIECDIVIVIIDLILLQQAAYRHILFNDCKNFWKLSTFLLMTVAYYEWTLVSSFPTYPLNEDISKINESIAFIAMEFYKMCFFVAFRVSWFLLSVYFCTRVYCGYTKKSIISFTTIWHTISVSSFSIFLLLPVLIWNAKGVEDFHKSFIFVYMILSQLIAYRALCNSWKIWSVIVILSSYYVQIFVSDYTLDAILQIKWNPGWNYLNLSDYIQSKN